MENRTLLGLCVIVLGGCVSSVSLQHQVRRKVQSETRIKLPSDIAFTHESTGDIEGETCFNLVRKIDGICSLPNQCPEAIRDFQKGIQPQICNYKGHLPIICCPRSEKPVAEPTSIQSSRPISTAPPPPIIQSSDSFQSAGERISEKKCKEYMKLGIEESVVSFKLNIGRKHRMISL